MPERNLDLERKARLLVPAIFLVTFLAFLPVLRAGFVNWDDDKNFLDNPSYRGLGWTEIHWMWTSHHMGHYIPATWMTLGLDYTIWGMDPSGYHLTSLLWHCANAALFYLVALALLRIALGPGSGAVLAAVIAALAFALHPLRVESVAWVTERRDMVSGFFYLAVVWTYLQAHLTSRRKWYWASLGCFAVAVLAKEMTVTLAALLVLLDIYPLRRLGGGPGKWFGSEARRVWIEKIPFFAIALADTAVAFYALNQSGLTTPLARLPWFPRFAITIYGLAFYLWKMVLPFRLAPFYTLSSHRIDPHGLPLQLSAMVVIWLVAAAILFRKRMPSLAAVTAAYVLTLLPVLGIFHNGMQITADRYTYLSCLGWALLAGAGVALGWKACERSGIARGALIAGSALILVGLGVLTWRQAATWHDSETLWTHAIAVEPSFIAFNDRGMDLSSRGDVSGAIEDFRQSIALNPDYEYSHNNLGGSLLDLGDWDAASREFEAALRIEPNLPSSHNGWGYALMMQGRFDEAIAHFQTALRMYPEYDSARRNLAKAVALKNKPAGS